MNTFLDQIDFGNEAGDDVHPSILNSYFVEQKQFIPLLDIKQRIKIVNAKKGVGKSALLQWLAHRLRQEHPDALIIKCRGTDLVRSNFNIDSKLNTPNDYIQDWMIRICALINRELAKELKIALTDDSITLIESAELDGFKSKNLVSCLMDRFENILGQGVPKKGKAKNEFELFKRIKKNKIVILIDDLDATFQKTNDEQKLLSTFFTACRYLTQDVKEISFRVTMRTDVWALIRRYDEALDKIEQYVSRISWTEDDFRKLLYMRLKSQFEALKINLSIPNNLKDPRDIEHYYISQVFQNRMLWGDKDTLTYRVIFTLSYHRPRWAIQLCKLAQQAAIELNSNEISKEHIDQVWGEYGNKRISDLVAEHKHQCSTVEELINAFRGSDRCMVRSKLLEWIKNRILTHLAPIIEGKEVRSSVDIAHFLYRIGFIVARSTDPKGLYEHYHFDDMPDFLSSRTSDDFGAEWEIHPCYREALDITKLNYAQRQKFLRKRTHKTQ